MQSLQKKKQRKNCMSVSISFPIDLLDLIDENVAKFEFDSRSDFVVSVLKEKVSKNK